MSSPFPFVPRVVSKTKRKLPQDLHDPLEQQTSTTATTSRQPAAFRSSSPPRTSHPVEHKRIKPFSNEDYVALFSLALSDYALWVDSDLRRKLQLEWSNDSSNIGQGEHDEGEVGFIPLSYLLKHSKILAPLELEHSQTSIVKALRSDAAGVFEVRLLINDPSPSSWLSGHQNPKDDAGAYEVRRKDLNPRALSTKTDWDNRTLYVERIPVKYKTIPAIARFISALLRQRPSSKAASNRIQGVTFISHHLDKPGDVPSCKGFALIVHDDIEDAEFLLKRWHWLGQQNSGANSFVPDDPREEGVTEVREADQFGFRCLSKLHWDQLKKEYLGYRSQLVSEINAYEDANRRSEPTRMASPTAREPITLLADEDEDEDEGAEVGKEPALATPVVDYSSPYPFNCLAFVRRVHPETNKTTLRKLFGAAFLTLSSGNGGINGDGIDYVDYNKGLDSCHIRLATQHHAKALERHFREHPTAQTSGLDETGVAATDDSKSPVATNTSIVVEVVTGKREELYWHKVPEKVRRQAVQKAVESVELSSSSRPSGYLGHGNGRTRVGAKRRK